MSEKLPVRIKQQIRDQIIVESSQFNELTKKIKDVLGHTISFDPEWPQLWSVLQPHFSDQATFVPYISEVLVSWCDAFLIWLNDASNEELVEKLLEDVKYGTLPLRLEMASSASTRPTTNWNQEKGYFTITLPKAAPNRGQNATSGFSSDFSTLLSSTPKPTSESTDTAPTPSESLQDWSLDSPTSFAINTPISSAYPMRPTTTSAPDERMKDMANIPRPEELTKRPPYWMIVRQEGRSRVTVLASHSHSLALLEQYLKRWCRGDPNYVGRPAAVDVRIQESSFGMGMMNDTLVLEAQRHREVTPMLCLVFIESILGYTLVPSNMGGSSWEFRRTTGFM